MFVGTETEQVRIAIDKEELVDLLRKSGLNIGYAYRADVVLTGSLDGGEEVLLDEITVTWEHTRVGVARSSNFYSVKLGVHSGADLSDCIREAIALAQATNKTVEFEFNGKQARALPTSTHKEVYQRMVQPLRL